MNQRNYNFKISVTKFISRKYKQKLRFLLIIFLLLCVIIYVNGFKNVQNAHIKILDYTSGLMKTYAKLDDYITSVQSDVILHFDLHDKYKILQKENEIMREELTLKQILASENEDLKKLIEFDEKISFEFISARIIRKIGNEFENNLLLDVGSKNKLYEGSVVFLENKYIGRVVEISENIAEVMLATDLNSKIPVISEVSKDNFIAAGYTENQLEPLYLSKDMAITDGELIYSVGDGEDFPPDLLVGIAAYNQNNELFIKPAIDFKKLKFVKVAVKK